MEKKLTTNVQTTDVKHIPRLSTVENNSDWPEQLAVRIARYYYELGMTQQQIAAELNIGRARVIRLLAESRERGVVKISINSPLTENLDLADALVERFDLSSAEVCLVHGNDEQSLAEQLGRAAGNCLSRFIHANMTISVGWGITLRALAKHMGAHTTHDVSVVSLLGSLTSLSSISRFEATTELAARLSAECHYLPAPIICDSREARKLLDEQAIIQNIHAMALASDLAIVSIGGIDSSTIRSVGLVSDEEIIRIKQAGAVGNFLGFFIDTHGEIVSHPINDRIIGVSGSQFKKIPKRIMVSGGRSKLAGLGAVLKHGLVSELVTDTKTAQELLTLAG